MATSVKYQIFISSTFEDLKDHRKGVIEQILMQEHIPAGMESFTAGNEEDFSIIKKAIDQCDIYIVLIGACFGSPFQGTRTSFTQREFRYAREDEAKPILAFVMDDHLFGLERKKFLSDDLATSKERERAERERKYEDELKAFRKEVKQLDKKGKKHRLVSYFTSVEDLKAKFAAALDKLIHNPAFDMPGWQRFSSDVGRNVFIQNLVHKLSEFDKLSARCVLARPGLKEAMATFFWDQHTFDLVKKGIRHLFFESGSTIAYLSSMFCKRLSTDAGQRHRSEWKIKTNNILTYLEFVLCENIQIDLYPHGPPESKYGATFGSLKEEEPQGFPTQNIPLSISDTKALDAVKAVANQILPTDKPSIIFGTASGLELRVGSDFPGPHVGTYFNKLFKRALLESRHPMVLFLDEQKISPFGALGNFKIGECHQVCDADIPWEHVCQHLPIAICVGAAAERNLDKIAKLLDACHFTERSLTKQYGRAWVTLVANAAYVEAFGKVSQRVAAQSRGGLNAVKPGEGFAPGIGI